MARRLRVYVAKREDVGILVHHRRRQLAPRHAAKKACGRGRIGHGIVSGRSTGRSRTGLQGRPYNAMARTMASAAIAAVSNRKIASASITGRTPRSRAFAAHPARPRPLVESRSSPAHRVAPPGSARRTRRAAAVRHDPRWCRPPPRSAVRRAHPGANAPPDCSSAAAMRAITFARNLGPSPRGETLRDRCHSARRQLVAASSALFSASHSIRSRSATGTTRCTTGRRGTARHLIHRQLGVIPPQPRERAAGYRAEPIHHVDARSRRDAARPQVLRGAGAEHQNGAGGERFRDEEGRYGRATTTLHHDASREPSIPGSTSSRSITQPSRARAARASPRALQATCRQRSRGRREPVFPALPATTPPRVGQGDSPG